MEWRPIVSEGGQSEVVRDRQGLGKGCLLLPTLFNLYSYVWNGRGIGMLYRMGVTKGVDNGGAGGGGFNPDRIFQVNDETKNCPNM